jgi:hypothetical protein
MEMLARGVQSENILVLVQSDITESDPLYRSVISKGKVENQKLDATNSASEKVFAEFLNWTDSYFSGNKWAITFLGHGGNLDEISPDIHPIADDNEGTQWMNIHKLNDVICQFKKQLDGQIELIFLQNCCKGTIEAFHTFRDASKYTMSSQMPVGSPNNYYDAALQFLGAHPEIHGGVLAEKIMEFEDPSMYSSYTVVNNALVRDLPSKCNPLIESILEANVKNLQIDDLNEKSWSYRYLDDCFADIITFFKWAVDKSGANPQKLDDFVNFITEDVIHKFQESSETMYPNLSGISLYIPSDKSQLAKYKHLEVFSDLNFFKLFNNILTKA